MSEEKKGKTDKKAELERPYVWEPRKRRKAAGVASGIAESQGGSRQGNAGHQGSRSDSQGKR
jgi:hypothetical protein